MSAARLAPRLLAPLALALSAALAAGCGSDSDDSGSAPAADLEGCEHLADGPSVAVTAATAAGDAAPKVSNNHKRYDLTLPGASTAGFVRFEVAAAATYVFFTDTDVDLDVSPAANGAVFLLGTRSSPACDTVKGRFQAELAVGAYDVSLTSTTGTRVSLVIEETDTAQGLSE